MPATPAWLASVEAMLNRGIGASAQAAALARRLEGTSLQVDIEGFSRVRAAAVGGRLALLAGRRCRGGICAGGCDHCGIAAGVFAAARGWGESATRESRGDEPTRADSGRCGER